MTVNVGGKEIKRGDQEVAEKEKKEERGGGMGSNDLSERSP